MVTIAELLKANVGLQVEDVTFAIKTFKKIWQDPNDNLWTQQVLLTDKTGDILADVYIGEKYSPLRGRVLDLNIVSAEVQLTDDRNVIVKKLYVDEFFVPTYKGDEYDKWGDDLRARTEREIRGKIATWIVAGKAGSASAEELLAFVRDPDFKAVIDEIMGV